MTEGFETPKQTQLLLNATTAAPESAVSAQALASVLTAGWPDPLPEYIASAIFMGCSYVMNLSRMAYEAGSITPEENAAVQGVSELAMQIWKRIYEQSTSAG